jgi:trehalose 6-phosphate synthase
MNASQAPLEAAQRDSDISLARLIVVSNREPYEHRLVKNHLVWERTSGGLVSALDPMMRRLRGTASGDRRIPAG